MRSRRAAKRRTRISWPERMRMLVMTGALPALAMLGAGAVGAGGFEPPAAVGWAVSLLGVAVLSAGLEVTARRWRGPAAAGPLQAAAGPLLWTVAVWMLYRLLAASTPQIILLPAGYLAWLAVSYPLSTLWPPLTVAMGMETALTLIGGQTPQALAINLVSFGTAIAGLSMFARSRVYRRQLRRILRRTREEQNKREYARDLGLHTDRSLGGGLEKSLENRPSTIETITTSLNLQLELLRQALGLTTATVLWPDADSRELRLRAHASARDDLFHGPYPLGQGIAGALHRTGNELAVAPLPGDYSGLPYYRSTVGAGSLYALKIADETAAGGKTSAACGILCVDRAATTAWTETECRVLRLASQKIAKEVAMGRRLEDTDRERHTNWQIYKGLLELNGVLDLESAFAASVKAIHALVRVDFTAISLLNGGLHRVVYAHGWQAERVTGLEFPREDGLVGQVLKLNRSLPPGGSYRGAVPVFSRDQRLAEFGSLMILPLRKEKGDPIGALVVAARESGIFTENRLQILELIATQVAVKIDLAQAHERINNMAITDGLTGLANHRTFQHGFDRMLCRAGRDGSPLCLLLCDLDYFKQINDTYGHPFGDQVLKAVAEILAGEVRQVDLPARYGGEEFAVLLERTDRLNGTQVADRIRREVEKITLWQGKQRITPTISIGLAVYPEDGEMKAQLIGRADRALYHAKETGRNRVSAWAQLPPE